MNGLTESVWMTGVSVDGLGQLGTPPALDGALPTYTHKEKPWRANQITN